MHETHSVGLFPGPFLPSSPSLRPESKATYGAAGQLAFRAEQLVLHAKQLAFHAEQLVLHAEQLKQRSGVV